MAAALKCPNPSCPYLFDPSTVPPGVVLACPRCGMRFTLGPPTATTPPSPADAAQTATFSSGVPGVPPGYPSAPTGAPAAPSANPTEAAFGGMTPDTARADGAQGPRLPVRESPLQTYLLFGVGVVALMAAGIAIWFKLSPNKPEPDSTGGPKMIFKEVNMGFESLPSPWAQDSEMRRLLDAPFLLVYKRENPEAYMAFGARDYKTREPRASELRDELSKALNKIVEPESRKEFAEEIDKFWMGQPTRGYKFSGVQRSGGSVEGEAMAVSHNGVAYWFISMTGANDIYEEQKSAFFDGRSRSQLLDLRKDWKAKEGATVDYKNTEIGYTLRDPDGLWKEVDDKDREKDADKMLTVALGKKINLQKHGTLLVHVLPGSDDPIAEARRFVTERRAAEIKTANPNLSAEFADRTDPPTDQPANTVEQSSKVIRLRSTVKNASTQNRLYVVSGAKVGEHTVVVQAWCDWGEHDDFEGMFMQIAGSLRSDRERLQLSVCCSTGFQPVCLQTPAGSRCHNRQKDYPGGRTLGTSPGCPIGGTGSPIGPTGPTGGTTGPGPGTGGPPGTGVGPTPGATPGCGAGGCGRRAWFGQGGAFGGGQTLTTEPQIVGGIQQVVDASLRCVVEFSAEPAGIVNVERVQNFGDEIERRVGIPRRTDMDAAIPRLVPRLHDPDVCNRRNTRRARKQGRTDRLVVNVDLSIRNVPIQRRTVDRRSKYVTEKKQVAFVQLRIAYRQRAWMELGSQQTTLNVVHATLGSP